MKKILYVILSVIFITGCNTLPLDWEPVIEKAEIILISFYGFRENELDEEYIVLKFSTKEEMREILNYISNESTPFYKCGYQGAIDVLSNGASILDEKMEFNIGEDCQHIILFYNGKLLSRKLTPGGISFLKMHYDKIPDEVKKF